MKSENRQAWMVIELFLLAGIIFFAVSSLAKCQGFEPSVGPTVNWALGPPINSYPPAGFSEAFVIVLQGKDSFTGEVFYTRRAVVMLGPIEPLPGIPQPGPRQIIAQYGLVTRVTINEGADCSDPMAPILLESGGFLASYCPEAQ